MNQRNKKLLLWIFLGLCLFTSELNAQFSNLKFETYSTLEGVSSSTCVEIFQDSEGYLWFGTIDGLNRYDGYSFETFRPILNDPNSISNNRINAIVEDGAGNLWIGTGNGLNVFQKQKEKFFRIDLFRYRKNSVNARDAINDLYYETKTNTLWVATRNGLSKLPLDGADHATYQNLYFKHYSHDINYLYSIDHNNVTNIVADQEGQILVATDGEYLNLYNPEKDNFERVLVDVPSAYKLGHIPKLLLVDDEGDIWIGNDVSKLVVWDKKNDSFKTVSYTQTPTPIFHIYQDKSGMIWIATDGFGIFLIDKEKGLLQQITHNPADPFSLPNNQPSNILEGRNGIFWIASYNKGVSKLALFKSSFGHYFHQPGNKNSLSTLPGKPERCTPCRAVDEAIV